MYFNSDKWVIGPTLKYTDVRYLNTFACSEKLTQQLTLNEKAKQLLRHLISYHKCRPCWWCYTSYLGDFECLLFHDHESKSCIQPAFPNFFNLTIHLDPFLQKSYSWPFCTIVSASPHIILNEFNQPFEKNIWGNTIVCYRHVKNVMNEIIEIHLGSVDRLIVFLCPPSKTIHISNSSFFLWIAGMHFITNLIKERGTSSEDVHVMSNAGMWFNGFSVSKWFGILLLSARQKQVGVCAVKWGNEKLN